MRVLLIVAVLLLGGCTGEVYSGVSSYSAKAPPAGTTYIISPAKEEIDPADLEFVEYAAHVQRALAARGWQRVAIGEPAAMDIRVDYGIGEPNREVRTANIPTYGQTGIASAKTTSTVTTVGNTSTIKSKTTYKPEYGITGYEPMTYIETTYDRFLTLNAYELPADDDGRPVEIWRTIVASKGITGDLRAIMPYLAIAAGRHAATSTGQVVPVTIAFRGKAFREFIATPAQ